MFVLLEGQETKIVVSGLVRNVGAEQSLRRSSRGNTTTENDNNKANEQKGENRLCGGKRERERATMSGKVNLLAFFHRLHCPDLSGLSHSSTHSLMTSSSSYTTYTAHMIIIIIIVL